MQPDPTLGVTLNDRPIGVDAGLDFHADVSGVVSGAAHLWADDPTVDAAWDEWLDDES